MTFEPRWRIPPGELLAEELHERAMSPLSLSAEMGVSLEVVQDLLSGELDLTDEVAGQLQQALGISAGFWLRMESAWRNPRLSLNVADRMEIDEADLPSLGDVILVGTLGFTVESDKRHTFRSDEDTIVWEMVLRAASRAPLEGDT